MKKAIILPAIVLIAVGLAVSCSSAPHKRDPELRTIYYVDSMIVASGDSVISRLSAQEGSYIISTIPDYQSRFIFEKRQILSVCAIILLLMIASFAIYASLKHQMIKKMNGKFSSISETVEELLEDRISMLEAMSRENISLKKKIETDYYPDELENLKDKVSTISLSMERLYQKVPMTKTLETALNTTKDGIMDKARVIFLDSIKETDYQILAGMLSGLNAKEIGFVTGLTPGTVRVRKSRLKDKVKNLPNSLEKDLLMSAFSK